MMAYRYRQAQQAIIFSWILMIAFCCQSLQADIIPDDEINSQALGYFQQGDALITIRSNIASIPVVTVNLALLDSELSGCQRRLSNNDPILLQSRIRNLGFAPPKKQSLIVDGQSIDAVLVTLDLPEGITADSAASHTNTSGRVIVLPSDSNQWVSLEQWQGTSTLSQIALLLNDGALAVDSEVAVNFDLVVDDPRLLPVEVALDLAIDTDADGNKNFAHRWVCINDDPSPLPGVTLDFRQLNQQDIAQIAYNDPNVFIPAAPYILDDEPIYQLPKHGLYLEMDANRLDLDTQSKAAFFVDLYSEKTGDRLVVKLLETTNDSGLFRSVAPIVLASQPTDNKRCENVESIPIYDERRQVGCQLHAQLGDRLVAEFKDSENRVDVSAVAGVVEDYTVKQALEGIVYHSESDERIAGALVEVMSTAPIQAVVDRVTTNSQGEYQFTQLVAGQYFLRVSPMDTYQFPSKIDPSLIDAPYGDIVPAAYGKDGFLGAQTDQGIIALKPTGEPLVVNIPLDKSADQRLVVTKEASVVEAAIGDRVKYLIRIKNISKQTAVAVDWHDQLPFGFKYEKNTLKKDGSPIKPTLLAPSLSLALGNLAYDEEITLSYVAKLTAGALDSDGINRAYAINEETRSDTATAKVTVKQQGLLSDKAIIFGQLFIDNQCDNDPDAKRWPVAGVRLYLEDGSFVITDENGQYSFYGIRPGMHVLKLDNTTLPAKLTPYPFDNRFAADADSRFVDLMPGDFHRADFAFRCPSSAYRTAVYESLKARNQSIDGDWLLTEALQFKGALETQGVRTVENSNEDGDISSGLLGTPAVNDNNAQSHRSTPQTDESVIFNKPMPSAKVMAESLDKAAARQGVWLWPESSTSLDGKLMYAVRQGVIPELFINGQKVDKSHLGENVQFDQQSLQVHAWYRLPFHEGDNTVEVKALDPFGNVRTLLKERVIYQPGTGHKLRINASSDTLAADRGRSLLTIDITLLDVFNRKSKGLEFVTLTTTEGQWHEKDIQPETPGHQIRVINGFAQVHLKSSLYKGEVDIKAQWQQQTEALSVTFIEPQRPLLAVGFVDLSLQANQLQKRAVSPTDQADGFDDTFKVDGQSALFLKGKIKGDMLLTLSYDNKKSKDTELLRDIDPNAYYPIYGDASIKGYDAQSRSKLYVKLEKSKNALMWGDFKTDHQTLVDNSLGRTSRTLTGASGKIEQGIIQVKGYAASIDNHEKIEEIPANGTATFYTLTDVPVVAGSETIDIIIRDLQNPGLIVSETTLVNNQDYVLGDYSGHLRLFEPLPSFVEGNPVFLRIQYQSETKVDAHGVAGVAANIAINEQWQTGASYQYNDHKTEGSGLATGHIQWALNAEHQVIAEVAHQSHNDDLRDEGKAIRVEMKNNWHKKLKSRLTYARANAEFDNPAASISAARQELKADADYQITDKTEIALEARQSDALAIDEKRLSAGVDVKHRWSDWTLTLGTRHIQQDSQAQNDQFQTGKVRIDKGFNAFDRNGNVFLAYEQDLTQSDRKAWSAGTEYEIMNNMRAYLKHDVIDGFSGVTSLSTGEQRAYTQLGVKADINDNAQTYSELRLRGGINGEALNAVNGIRSRVEIEEGLDFMPSVEVVNRIQGTDDETREGYSVSLSLNDFRSENAKKAIRIENRRTDQSIYYAFDASYAARINQDWTALYMNNLYFDDGKQSQLDRLNNVLTLGSAYRPKLKDRWNALFFYQWKKQINIAEDSRYAHIVSTHHNLSFAQDYRLTTRLAMKFQHQKIDDQDFNAQVYLTGLRLIKPINWRWDLDIRMGLLSSGLSEDRRYSFGMGAHYLLDKNLRLGLSYNLVGFEEEDLDAQSYYAQGFKLGIQLKFDEDLFKWLQ